MHEFKSEEYLENIINLSCTDPSNNIVLVHAHSTGGFISGEVKLAMTLHILCGGSYLYTSLLFEVSFNHVHKIVKEVINNWLIHESLMGLPIV